MKLLKKLKIPKCSSSLKFFLVGLAAYIIYRIVRLYIVKEGFESKPANFNSDVSDGNKLVWFYADWCGHCKPMHKDWDAAASEVNKDGMTKMIKIDAGGQSKQQQKIAKDNDVQGFPTISLFNNGKKVEEYNGDRKKEAFLEFVNSKI